MVDGRESLSVQRIAPCQVSWVGMQVGMDVGMDVATTSEIEAKKSGFLIYWNARGNFVAFRGTGGNHLCHVDFNALENPIVAALVRLHQIAPRGLRFEHVAHSHRLRPCM